MTAINMVYDRQNKCVRLDLDKSKGSCCIPFLMLGLCARRSRADDIWLSDSGSTLNVTAKGIEKQYSVQGLVDRVRLPGVRKGTKVVFEYSGKVRFATVMRKKKYLLFCGTSTGGVKCYRVDRIKWIAALRKEFGDRG